MGIIPKIQPKKKNSRMSSMTWNPISICTFPVEWKRNQFVCSILLRNSKKLIEWWLKMLPLLIKRQHNHNACEGGVKLKRKSQFHCNHICYSFVFHIVTKIRTKKKNTFLLQSTQISFVCFFTKIPSIFTCLASKQR